MAGPVSEQPAVLAVACGEAFVPLSKKRKAKVHGPGGAASLLGVKPTTLTSNIKSLGVERSR